MKTQKLVISSETCQIAPGHVTVANDQILFFIDNRQQADVSEVIEFSGINVKLYANLVISCLYNQSKSCSGVTHIGISFHINRGPEIDKCFHGHKNIFHFR